MQIQSHYASGFKKKHDQHYFRITHKIKSKLSTRASFPVAPVHSLASDTHRTAVLWISAYNTLHTQKANTQVTENRIILFHEIMHCKSYCQKVFA